MTIISVRTSAAAVIKSETAMASSTSLKHPVPKIAKSELDRRALSTLRQLVPDEACWTDAALLRLCKDVRHVAKVSEPPVSAFPRRFKDLTGDDLPYTSTGLNLMFNVWGGASARRTSNTTSRYYGSADVGTGRSTGLSRAAGLQTLLRAIPGLSLHGARVTLQSEYIDMSSSSSEDEDEDLDEGNFACYGGSFKSNRRPEKKCAPPFSLKLFKSIGRFPRLEGNRLKCRDFAKAICLRCSGFVIDPVLADCGHLYCYECILDDSDIYRGDDHRQTDAPQPQEPRLQKSCLGCDRQILRYQRLALKNKESEQSSSSSSSSSDNDESPGIKLLRFMYTQIPVRCRIAECRWVGTYWSFVTYHQPICSRSTIRGICIDSDDDDDDDDETSNVFDDENDYSKSIDSDVDHMTNGNESGNELLEQFYQLLAKAQPAQIDPVPIRIFSTRTAVKNYDPELATNSTTITAGSSSRNEGKVNTVKAGDEYELLAHPDNSYLGYIAVRKKGTQEQFWTRTWVFKRRGESRQGYFKFLSDCCWQQPIILENQ